MTDANEPGRGLRRRQAFAYAGAAAALVAADSVAPALAAGSLPVDEIERILQAPGKMTHGVLDVTIGRNDIVGVTGPAGQSVRGPRISFSAGFELNGDFFFQPLGDGRAIVNGDFGFLPHEINPAIDAMLKGGLQFQALHQHYYGLEPMVWFMHMRGIGAPLDLARAIAAVVQTTGTRLPQRKPPSSTLLNKDELGRILGAKPDVGDGGVVGITVPRTDTIRLGGVQVNPLLNVSTNIDIQALADGTAAAAPDFSMTAAEITPVMRVMRGHGWTVHCLYNQETDENPQLYFAHMLKVGDQYQLAREIREGLDQTAAKKA